MSDKRPSSFSDIIDDVIRSDEDVQPHLPRERERTVLVVEDEHAVLQLITRTLGFAGFEVQSATNVAEARALASQHKATVAVLDVTLPDGSGFDLAHTLRAECETIGLLFLTARDSLDDRLTGFALGADDYLTKPFSVAELVARVTALQRRVTAGGLVEPPSDPVVVSSARQLTVGDVTLDETLYSATRGEETLDLSPTEFKLLRYLMVNVDVVVSKEQIIEQVWRYDYVGDVGVVEKFVSQLRRKLGGPADSFIQTIRGFGYTVRSADGDA